MLKRSRKQAHNTPTYFWEPLHLLTGGGDFVLFEGVLKTMECNCASCAFILQVCIYLGGTVPAGSQPFNVASRKSNALCTGHKQPEAYFVIRSLCKHQITSCHNELQGSTINLYEWDFSKPQVNGVAKCYLRSRLATNKDLRDLCAICDHTVYF